jgi:16S rRNA (uracil1498-N3)-methyltransferase
VDALAIAEARVRRLYVPRSAIHAGRASLGEDATHYLRDVLRLAPGTELEAFDGEGGTYRAVWNGSEGGLAIGDRREGLTSRVPIWLAVALAKGPKTELVVEKATELGVRRVLPFAAERSVVKLAEERGEAKLKRWQKIAAEAARQCGRADVSQIDPARSLTEVIAAIPKGFERLLFYEGGGVPLRAREPLPPGCVAVIGPEGGFSPAEVSTLVAAGFQTVTLGPRILRAETAAIVAAGLLQHLFES